MPEVASLTHLVATVHRDYRFAVVVHRSERPEEQRIDPEFYLESVKCIHQGAHHELHLVVTPVTGRIDPNVPIHVHPHPRSHELFVCYTPQVPTLDEAEDLFRQWCVGTVYAIENKKDFTSIIGEHPDDFLKFMEKEHGIVIAE